MSQTVDFSEDIFDIRDVISEYETLEDRDDLDKDEATKRTLIRDFLDEVRGNGGDEQWRGGWYPVTFIRESYFEDYARDLADDLYGQEVRDAKWPFSCIDWEHAARELRYDYTATEIDGTTYLYR